MDVYCQGSLTFIITPDKIVVRTGLQSFYLAPRQNHWTRRIKLIRTMIQRGEIIDLNDLSTWCGTNIEWVPTAHKYMLEKAEILV